jgi:hypothetical protein
MSFWNVVHDMKTVDVTCPECGLRSSCVAVPTPRGAYCYCASCRHLWHHDGPEVHQHRRAEMHPRRRRTDGD